MPGRHPLDQQRERFDAQSLPGVDHNDNDYVAHHYYDDVAGDDDDYAEHFHNHYDIADDEFHSILYEPDIDIYDITGDDGAVLFHHVVYDNGRGGWQSPASTGSAGTDSGLASDGK